jgi:hypothetical protein
MKYFRTMLAIFGLFVAGGATNAARADDDHSTTLYTSAIHATGFHCNAVNVSRRTLYITISVIGADGHLLPPPSISVSPPIPTGPAAEASFDVDTSDTGATEGYCKFQVFGTGDRDDLRAVLNATLTRTVPGTNDLILLSRALEAH